MNSVLNLNGGYGLIDLANSALQFGVDPLLPFQFGDVSYSADGISQNWNSSSGYNFGPGYEYDFNQGGNYFDNAISLSTPVANLAFDDTGWSNYADYNSNTPWSYSYGGQSSSVEVATLSEHFETPMPIEVPGLPNVSLPTLGGFMPAPAAGGDNFLFIEKQVATDSTWSGDTTKGGGSDYNDVSHTHVDVVGLEFGPDGFLAFHQHTDSTFTEADHNGMHDTSSVSTTVTHVIGTDGHFIIH